MKLRKPTAARPYTRTSPHMATFDDAPLVVTLPIRVMSEMNLREHWAKRNARKNAQQTFVAMHMRSHRRPKLPVLVRLTREGPRKMDSDGNVIAFKHVRDELARWLGCDDGSEADVLWEYSQTTGQGVPYAITIRIEARHD